MSLDFYDRDRKPIVYTDDDEHLYAYCGRPVAYFYEGSVYSYPGRHLGFISDGVIRDNNGHIVLYTADSRGGGMKPYLPPARRKGPSICDISNVDGALNMKSFSRPPGGQRYLVSSFSLERRTIRTSQEFIGEEHIGNKSFVADMNDSRQPSVFSTRGL